ncbi:Pescadillo N-terminus-domain-containing protein [Vararia minispora EC-137]|uniref:Pescadillo N-terminus-domain-containing protein n=1 Tax=Vararia minispora EC-137 TaxID=1314806 RepID=A0ACB8QP84_9AGAM|nr:Pescadillo N-terminus-domain-containing protein [Vararia minispora EC-137]
MGRLRQKGKAGAAKAYVTRTQAVKKLQCSLADFRRLSILKGIFPREPKHRKKANKGSSAPTTFYYAKDIAYLAHEPVLRKLREHKAFAKRLSRALGRGEWSSAKSLEEQKPVYSLDHIIKERYPTFIDAVRDIDDALCMIFLFASLPSNSRVSASLVDNCSRLAAEWQLYVMHTHALRKVFLSIKGIYYQAEVMDQLVTWLVPYQFTQNIPADVDVRVMLTFLELYQTLLGFVLFKLYTDTGLVYPPPLDAKKQEAAAGVGALSLQESSKSATSTAAKGPVVVDGKRVSGKDVRQTIKALTDATPSADEDVDMPVAETDPVEAEEEFVPHPSTSNPDETAALPTLQSLSSLPQSVAPKLFAPYTFWLSRETSRPVFEFVVRSFGGRIGWPESSGAGSPFNEDDDTITHVIIDRPLVERLTETDAERQRRLRRKYVQPQWIVDCINAGKILLEDAYAQGKTLPPHLSPFGDIEGAYDPLAASAADAGMAEEESDEDVDEEEAAEEDEALTAEGEALKSAAAAVAAAADDAALRAAELDAEAAGVEYGAFEKEVAKSQKKAKKAAVVSEAEEPEDMNKMMMSNRQRKQYERAKYNQQKQVAEVRGLLPGGVSAPMLILFVEREAGKQTEGAEEGGETEGKGVNLDYETRLSHFIISSDLSYATAASCNLQLAIARSWTVTYDLHPPAFEQPRLLRLPCTGPG